MVLAVASAALALRFTMTTSAPSRANTMLIAAPTPMPSLEPAPVTNATWPAKRVPLIATVVPLYFGPTIVVRNHWGVKSTAGLWPEIPLCRGHSAVYDEFGSRDKPRFVGSEVEHA